jgi:uncharacterized protein (UPF0248 family)
MATAVRIEWHMGDDQSMHVIVETEEGRPDALDEIAHRAIYLFDQALAKVIATSEDVPLSDS